MTRSYFLPCLACLSMSATAILIQALDILNIFCVPAISKTVSISQNYFSSWQTALLHAAAAPAALPRCPLCSASVEIKWLRSQHARQLGAKSFLQAA